MARHLNGVLEKLSGASHDFRFQARKGEKLVILRLTPAASAANSIRCSKFSTRRASLSSAPPSAPCWDTVYRARGPDSASRGIRIQAWNALAVGDYLYDGRRDPRVESHPRRPDDDLVRGRLRRPAPGIFRIPPPRPTRSTNQSTKSRSIRPAIEVRSQRPAAGAPLLPERRRRSGLSARTPVWLDPPADGDYIRAAVRCAWYGRRL